MTTQLTAAKEHVEQALHLVRPEPGLYKVKFRPFEVMQFATCLEMALERLEDSPAPHPATAGLRACMDKVTENIIGAKIIGDVLLSTAARVEIGDANIAGGICAIMSILEAVHDELESQYLDAGREV